jgi:outer membrane protein assembly factor BamB
MKHAKRAALILGCLASTMAGGAWAQDWPQWRGPNRDAKAAGFKAPKAWPKELKQQWKTEVGEGVATPALVGDKLFVFSRQDGNEVLRCLNAADGKEHWQDKYESLGASGPASGFSGPRSSPAVADGKVVTLGVRGMISCLEAASGKKLWRKDDFKAWPGFHPSSSPIIVDGLCVAQLGGRENGALVAYDLASGAEKWKWSGGSPSYASPALLTVGDAKLIVAQTESKLAAVNAADGKLAWEGAAAPRGEGGGPGGGGGGGGRGGGRDYKAATPIVEGQTIISAGREVKAFKLEKESSGFVAKELWTSSDKTVSFNSPVLKNGLLYGLTGGNELFCLNAKDGKLAWSAPAGKAGEGQPGGGGPGGPGGPGAQRPEGGPPGQGGPGRQGGPGGPRGPGGRGGGRGGGGGYGSIVDAGTVMLALTPGSELIAFEPDDKAYKELARIKISDSQTHAYPVVSGNRIFIKDKESVTLWTVE